MKNTYAFFIRILAIIGYPVTGLLLHNSKRVRVLVEYKDQILLQRSSLGHQKWSIPGGGVEKGENPFAAAIREVREEVGVIITEDMLMCLGERRVASKLGWPAIDMLVYSATLTVFQEPKITRPIEILEVQWFNRNSIPIQKSDTVKIALKMQAATKK